MKVSRVQGIWVMKKRVCTNLREVRLKTFKREFDDINHLAVIFGHANKLYL